MTEQISHTECNTLVEILRWRARHQPTQRAYTFLLDGESQEVHLTYSELDQQARAIAARLQKMGITGEAGTLPAERALLLYPPGLDFISAFFGCLYAGVVAVPTYPPRRDRHDNRLAAILNDAQPLVALTTTEILSDLDRFSTHTPELAGLQWLATETLPVVKAWQGPTIEADRLAFLQYTSGSVGRPKGVMITHSNLLHNEEMLVRAFATTPESIVLGWLPLFHDMGLIGNVLHPLYLGTRCILMSPVAFLQKPIRWLQAISRFKATTSGGPNFAYDLCVDKITPEQRSTLDLSSWTAAFNGAEPVRAATLQRFTSTFEVCGFRPETFYPCYGMAENTLFVSGGQVSALPVLRQVEKAALAQNRVVIIADEREDAQTRVGCGHACLEQKIVIVDPESATLCPDGQVGEIWVKGLSVAKGYWNQPEETKRTFRRGGSRTAPTLATPPLELGGDKNKRGASEGAFLRTGDLGFLLDGELFVTGRLKDLIIIRGRNYYPQDIELSAGNSHSALQPNAGAAFSVEVEGQERVVIVFELKRRHRKANVEEVATAIRGAVAQEHKLEVYGVVLIRPARLPKTTSGKVQRYACRKAFLEGSLPVIGTSIRDVPLVGDHEPNETDEAALAARAETEVAPALTQAQIEANLRVKIADLLNVPLANIDLHQPIHTLGFGSVTAIVLKRHLEDTYKLVLPLELFFEEISMSEIIARLLKERHSATPSVMTASCSDDFSRSSPPNSQKTTKVVTTNYISQETEKQTAKQKMQFSLFYFSSNEAAFAQDKYQLLQEGSKFADQHDFTAIWVPERHFHAFGGLYPNPSLLASALAMITQQIRLRAGSVVLPLHHPIRVAEDWAVVDNLSQGRVDLSFATGWNPNDFVLSPEHYEKRVAMTYAGIESVQKLWRGESISQPNGIDQAHDVRIYPQPQQKELNVWLSCSGGPQRFIDAGRLGYNVLTALLFQPVDELAEKIALYREARGKQGYDPETGHVTLMLHTYIGEEMEEVRHKVRAPFIDYLKSSANLWLGGSTKPLEQLSEQEQQNMLTYGFERYYQTSALIGTPQTCLQMVERVKAIGVNEIACLIDFGVDMESVLASLNFLDELKVLAQK